MKGEEFPFLVVSFLFEFLLGQVEIVIQLPIENVFDGSDFYFRGVIEHFYDCES